MNLAKEEAFRRQLMNDFPFYAERCLKIRSKSGDITNLKINRAQEYVNTLITQQKLELGRVRCVILKGRQQGMSTLIEGRFFWLVTHRRGVRAFILTHEREATTNLFEMAQRYYEHCPPQVRPSIEKSNARELHFGKLDSGYRIGTAGNKEVGRSSTIQFLHMSEAAFYSNAVELARGIMQAVPNEPNTEIFIESTANGMGNFFHEQWSNAEAKLSDFIPIFVPWYWQEEYKRVTSSSFTLTEEENELSELFSLNKEQLNWRRYKIAELSVGGINGTKAFEVEYPNTSASAFQGTSEDTFIDPHTVLRARKASIEGVGSLLIGVDPARYGDDRTAIIRRQGRNAYKLESHVKKSTMEVVGIVHKIILDESPRKVFIDIGGLGAGIYDRLVELGFKDVVVAVNGGSTPLDQDRYLNKRAEMWGLLREWLLTEPVSIPDSDELHSDLCAIKYKFDSNTRLVMEKKEEMKKRGFRSSDCADALGLTFAFPEGAFNERIKQKDKDVAKSVMSTFNKVDKLKKGAYR
jgi:hypothetical protein